LERRKKGAHYKLVGLGNEVTYCDWLRKLLEYFDGRSIGDPLYKDGFNDKLGNHKDEKIDPEVGWEELHLWTPRYRRWPLGLPRRIRVDTNGVGRMVNGVEQFEYDEIHEPGELLQPTRVNLDLENIENMRKEREDRKLPEEESAGLGYASRSERRQQEIARYEGSRPNTLGLSFSTSAEGVALRDRWGNMRTEQGLFIAARESSWDWLTSYDCLDQVRPTEYPTILPVSFVRDEPPADDDDDDDDDADEDKEDIMIRTRDYDPVEDEDLTEDPPLVVKAPPATVKKTKGGKRKAGSRGGGRRTAKKLKLTDLSESSTAAIGSGGKKNPPTAAPANESEDAEGAGASEEPDAAVDRSWMRRRANVDYPYPKNEFHLPKRQRPTDGVKALSITPWAEETGGRREWHVYQRLSPFSEVYSPPRSPLRPDDIDPDSLPKVDDGSTAGDVWRIVNADESPALERRRCNHTDKCRAWWSHPAAECWIAHTEKTVRTTSTALKPLNVPLTMATSGVPTYHARLHDHYGIRPTPNQEARWPKLRIWVPYDPMTIDKMNPPFKNGVAVDSPDPVRGTSAGMSTESIPEDTDPQEPEKPKSGEQKEPYTYEFYTMAVPIITQPVRAWGVVDPEPPAAPGGERTACRPSSGISKSCPSGWPPRGVSGVFEVKRFGRRDLYVALIGTRGVFLINWIGFQCTGPKLASG
jgi:hypothetical protein